MTKTKKINQAVFLFFGLLSLTVAFIACRKNFTESTVDTFSQSEAKEWYYGTFKKSPEWQQSTEKGKKLPDWKNGTYRRVGNMEIVEFPLMKERKSFAIPSASKLSSSEKRKITDGSLSRIVFIRAANGEMVVREIDYIPEMNFLELKGYDISDLSVGTKENKFSGRIITKKWDGTILSIRKSENGKITKTGIRKSNSTQKGNSLSTTTTSNTSGCEMVEICEYERYCEEVHVGDAWVPTGECTPWESTGNCWVEEYCGPGECDYGSSESCECQLYGMGCEGGGGGGEDPPPPPPDPCTDAQPAANATTSLSQNSSYTGAKSNIQGANQTVEHSITFGTDANGNTTASSMTSCTSSTNCTVNTSWPGAFADLHNHPTDQPPSPGDLYGLVTINQNQSNYNTRMVITPDGSVYALVVIDINLVNTFVSTYPKEQIGNYPPDFPDPIFTDFDNAKIQLQMQGFSNLVAEQMAMAFVLDKYNSGIALLKQDGNGNFKRLRTQENTANGNTTYSSNNCQ